MEKSHKIWWRVAKIPLILIVASIISFALMGDWAETFFNQSKCQQWFNDCKPYAWLVATLLLTFDLLLPLPATAIIAALGAVYGTFFGTLASTLAITVSGIVGYWISRKLLERYPKLLGNPDEARQFEESFDKWGPFLIILSRFTPILPEVVVILAGAGKMPFKRFLTALLLSAISTGFTFALLGDLLASKPLIAMIISVAAPVIIWLGIAPLLKKNSMKEPKVFPNHR